MQLPSYEAEQLSALKVAYDRRERYAERIGDGLELGQTQASFSGLVLADERLWYAKPFRELRLREFLLAPQRPKHTPKRHGPAARRIRILHVEAAVLELRRSTVPLLLAALIVGCGPRNAPLGTWEGMSARQLPGAQPERYKLAIDLKNATLYDKTGTAVGSFPVTFPNEREAVIS